MQHSYVISGKKMGAIKRIFKSTLIANILGWLVTFLGTFADSIIGGLILGEEALSAIEIIMPLASVIFSVSYLVSTGGALLHAKYIGKNDFDSADNVFSSTFYFSIATGLLMFLIFIIGKETWLNIYGLEGSFRQLASDYYDPFIYIALITPLGTQIYNSANSDGDSLFTVIGSTLQTIINITLSFILVKHIGIKGLSIATFIGGIVCYLVPCIRFFSKSNTLHLKKKFSFLEIWRSMKVGFSAFSTVLFIAIVDILMNFYITKKFGASYVAPYAVVNFALEVASALTLVGQTMICIINFALGENNQKDIKDILKYSKKTAFYTSLAFMVVFMSLTPLWPKVFGLETEEFINYSIVASLTIATTFIPQTFMFLISNFYIATEQTSIAVLTNTLNSFVFPMIFPMLFATTFGYYGFVVGFAISNLFAVGSVYLILYIKNKKEIFVIPPSPANKYSIDLIIDNDSITKSILCVRDILKENNIDSIIANRVQVVLEESLMITLNNNKKEVMGRITIKINDEKVKLIVKDTGKIFDVRNPDQKIDNLSNFVLVMATSKSSISVNYVASSLNGNHYEFKLKEN